MVLVELHPEELIDKALAGRITPRERARLEAHIARCSVCRFERGAREELLREAPLVVSAARGTRR